MEVKLPPAGHPTHTDPSLRRRTPADESVGKRQRFRNSAGLLVASPVPLLRLSSVKNKAFLYERHDNGTTVCIEQLCDLVNSLALIREKIADGNCSFLTRGEIDCVLWPSVPALAQTEPVRRVEIGLEHLREIVTQSMQPLAELSVP
jgi:hypothetical protein